MNRLEGDWRRQLYRGIGWGLRCWFSEGLPIDNPRWRDPAADMAPIADGENGPAARSFAADAHDCIMVRIKRSYRIQVCGTKMHPMASSPRILIDTGTHWSPKLCKSPIAVHRRCACSGVKALRNTSDARRQAAKLCYRFGPLTPSARSANLIAGDGTKNGIPATNKEPPTSQK